MKIKPFGKLIILLIVVGIAVGAYRMMSGGGGLLSKIMPEAQNSGSAVPLKADLPSVGDSAPAAPIDGLKMPSSEAASVSSPEIRMLVYAWNAQMGIMFANGGPKTTKGSLMADRDVNLNISRQDDNDKLRSGSAALVCQGQPR